MERRGVGAGDVLGEVVAGDAHFELTDRDL